MSAQGRCAGCQETGPLKPLLWHVTQCSKWAALYQDSPSGVLGPAEEFERWSAEERPAEHDKDLAGRIADTQARRAASVARFKVRDPLED